MDVLLSSVKEISSLISKGMSNIYSKVTTEKMTFLKLRFSKFKNFLSRFAFREISLSFKAFCCNLKTRGLGIITCVNFLLLLL